MQRITYFSGVGKLVPVGDRFALPVSGASSALLLAAAAHSALGYSVIPLLGDLAPDRPKAPALPWSAYQTRRAAEADFQRWFVDEGYQAIGIVTGRISNLVVLDFDNPDLFAQFSALYPDLVENHVIQTRRGYHIYYQLPVSLHVSTRKAQGIDLLSSGCYVVARPSVIAGFAYKLIRGGQPKPLTPHALRHITAFLDQHAPNACRDTIYRVPTDAPTLTQSNANALTPPFSTQWGKGAGGIGVIQSLYRAAVASGKGRNQSLFNVALTARDHGWSQSAAQSALVDLHTHTVSPNHSNETAAQRQRESLKTIESAFSRPARPAHLLQINPLQLPNRVREALYALKLTCLVRTIEGLREKGIQPGQTFTRKQACFLLKGIVGRDSIDNALHATRRNGLPFIAREAAPSLEPSPASVDAAKDCRLPEIKKCFFDRTTKSGKMISGRKPRTYIMPSNSELCLKLGIRFSGSDPVQSDDLTSAKKTRQATHREFIRRRPGQYLRHWLAKRLGVSVRTTQRYDHELHIQAQPMFHEQPIEWGNLHLVPDEPLPGVFLMDDHSRRYPARREIAARLLPKVYGLYLMRQQANFYSLDPPTIVSHQIWKHQQKQQEQIEQRIIAAREKTETLPAVPVRPAAQPRSGLPPPATPSVKAAKSGSKMKAKPAPKLTKRRARQPLPNAYEEALAQRVYNLINSLTTDKQQRISQATARRAVFTYGTKVVENALRLLASRHHITKPAGFFMTVVRSEGKVSD